MGAPVRMTLWDRNGKQVEVLSTDVAYWMANGFSQAPVDPETALGEAMSAHKALGEAVELYARGCISDGAVDHGDESAHVAMQVAAKLFADRLRALVVAIDATFPRVEADPVIMLNMDGDLVAVDPSQVAGLQARGWVLQ